MPALAPPQDAPTGGDPGNAILLNGVYQNPHLGGHYANRQSGDWRSRVWTPNSFERP